jgi:hypothetical protein
MTAVEEQLSKLIRILARENPLTPRVIRESEITGLIARFGRKRLVRATLVAVKNLRTRRQYGKLRAALLLGVTCFGDEFLIMAEREGALLADGQSTESFRRFLEGLKKETDASGEGEWRILRRRLDTYVAYQELMTALAADDDGPTRLLNERPRQFVKMAMAMAALAFLRVHLEFEIPEQYSKLLDELGEPEEIASIASALVAAANEYSPLDSLDFALPGLGDLSLPELRRLMLHGKSRVEQFEIGKYISLFRYELDSVSTARSMFCVRPTSPEFEYSMRLGYIRAVTNVGIARVDVAARGQAGALSMGKAAERFAQKFKGTLAEIKDSESDWRRLRLNFPGIPKLYETLKNTVFYEDLISDEQLSRDFLIPLRYMRETEIKVTEHLNLETFHGIWRYVQFVGLVDSALLRDYGKADPKVLMNSLVRVIGAGSMTALLQGLGISEEQAKEFLDAISIDVERPSGFLDLQYRPALRIAPTWIRNEKRMTEREIVYLPALVITSNVARNVQSANRFRVELNAKSFVETTAHSLRERFARVETNKPVKGQVGATDIDVVVLEGDGLYLFECKHSLPPTGPHEMRDIWEEIEAGVRQLAVANQILADSVRRQSYLTGWFPGTRKEDTIGLKIYRCVLCSHRVFSGLEYKGVPIRDFSSLSRLCEGGIVGMGAGVADEEVILHQYRIIRDDTLSSEDLKDYLSPMPTFFKMFQPFMHPVSRMERLGAVTISKETFVYEVELEQWEEHLESLGCTRLADRRQRLQAAEFEKEYN